MEIRPPPSRTKIGALACYVDCMQSLMTAINLSISDFDSEPGFAWNLIQSFSRSTTDLVWISVSM